MAGFSLIPVDQAWVGAISVLAGVIVSEIAQAFRASRSFKREKIWANRDERRRYLEELWERLDDLNSGYDTLYDRAVRPHHWVSDAQTPSVDLPWPRVRMIVALYLPEFKSMLNSLEMAGTEFDEVLGRAEGTLPGLKTTRYEDLADASEHFEDALKRARSRITDETRAITRAREASTAPPDALRR
jgi:ElaB/YqjD/DUF883 family membrane-anchored ribosome-binding protein